MALPARKSHRLPNEMYLQGCFFITVCTKERRNCLSALVGADSIRPPEVHLTHAGAVVQNALKKIEEVYPACRVLSYVIMPNHLHFLLEIRPVTQGGRQIAAPTVIGQFKRQVSRELGYSLWQKSYYDHIIRDEDDYLNKCRYIEENPAKWVDDPYYNNSSAPA